MKTEDRGQNARFAKGKPANTPTSLFSVLSPLSSIEVLANANQYRPRTDSL
jgi:hypothetical protein